MTEDRKKRIRVATPQDAEALLAVYAPYVTDTAITFEYEVPSLTEFRERIRHTLERYPYLVMEQDGEILGYAYAGPFKERAAYDWAVETTIYVKQGMKEQGIGRKLYQALEDTLIWQNILNLNACIGYPTVEDEYLTRNSMEFHQHLGYRLVGQFYQCGYKFGRWYDMVWMEKLVGEHGVEPVRVKPFPELQQELEL
ncbi:MAG: GNAT family N-acetyltransferase [Clostridium sp.]|nr:GNAT family N-acetyltransferase [Clostridium sp.]